MRKKLNTPQKIKEIRKEIYQLNLRTNALFREMADESKGQMPNVYAKFLMFGLNVRNLNTHLKHFMETSELFLKEMDK